MCIRDRPRLPHSWVYTPFRSGIPFRHRLRLPSRCVCPFCLKIQDKLRHTGAEKSLDGRPLQGLSEVHGVGLCIGVSKPGKCLADDGRFDECRAEALDGIVRNDAKWCRLEHCVEIHEVAPGTILHDLSLIHISEPTRLGMISYAVF